MRRRERTDRQLMSAAPAPLQRSPAAARPRPTSLDARERASLQLQRLFGNQEVARMVRRGEQTGSRLDRSGDPAVQRADDVHQQSISETTDTGNKYTQDLQVNKTRSQIEIMLGIKWNKQGTWANDAAAAAFRQSIKSAVYSYMDNKFKIIATPSAALVALGSKPLELSVTMLLYDYDGGYPVDYYGGQHGRSAMAAASGSLFELGQVGETSLPAITAAHEMGHAMLGASDEYENPAVPARVISNDHSLMGNYYAQGVAAAQVKARHFEHIVAPVAAQYPGFTCKLAPV